MSCPLLAYYKMKPYLDKIDEYMKENYELDEKDGWYKKKKHVIK